MNATISPAGPIKPLFETSGHFSQLNTLLLFVLALGAVKIPLGLPLYFNMFTLLVGLIFLVSRQVIHVAYVPVILLVVIGFIGPIDTGSLMTSGPRLIQLLLVIFASMFVARMNPVVSASTWLMVLLPIALIVFIGEFTYDSGRYARPIAGEDQRRLAGMIGEPNFNGALYGTLALLAFYVRKKWFALAFVCLAMFSLSRGFGVALVVWLLAVLFNRTRFGGLFFWSAVLFFVLQPIFLWIIDLRITDELRELLVIVSSHRYAHWTSYLNMGLSSPLGVGYFQGIVIEASYGSVIKAQQAHNLPLQVFSEFGWFGYLLFSSFILNTARNVWKYARGVAPMLVYLIVVYSFLNALSEWGLWIGIGFLYANVMVGRALYTRFDHRTFKRLPGRATLSRLCTGNRAHQSMTASS
ncbi:MAG: O-antigen ligase family protein [Gammaproteobacteria bacterium]|nr:O-antigen ligase family protein [Gammaproteobacteria bacterium]